MTSLLLVMYSMRPTHTYNSYITDSLQLEDISEMYTLRVSPSRKPSAGEDVMDKWTQSLVERYSPKHPLRTEPSKTLSQSSMSFFTGNIVDSDQNLPLLRIACKVCWHINHCPSRLICECSLDGRLQSKNSYRRYRVQMQRNLSFSCPQYPEQFSGYVPAM